MRLSCNHCVCIPCGRRASATGHQSCPICRAPHELNQDTLNERLSNHRADYKAWRQGSAKGATGQLDGISAPALNVHPPKGLAYHPACGILEMGGALEKAARLKQSPRSTSKTAIVISKDSAVQDITQAFMSFARDPKHPAFDPAWANCVLAQTASRVVDPAHARTGHWS